MNLLCPHCARQLQVPEQYAGTLMKCPICEKTFTVPVLPSMPAAAPPPPPPPVPQQSPAFTSAAPSAAFEKAGTSTAPAGYHHTRSLTVNPRTVPVLAPACLLLVLGLLFFSWAGLYPVGDGVLTQTAWQAAIGATSANSDWDAYAGKETKWSAYFGTEMGPLKGPGLSLVMLAFLGTFLVTLALALVSAAFSLRLVAIDPPAGLAGVWPYRSLLVAGLALASLVLLSLVSIGGLPLQARVSEQASAIVDQLKKAPDLHASDLKDENRWAIEKGVRESGMGFRTTIWFSLAWLLTLVAVLGAGLTAWLDTRTAQPPPRLDLIW